MASALCVPANAPATTPGRQIDWFLEVRVHLPLGPDVTVRAPIEVPPDWRRGAPDADHDRSRGPRSGTKPPVTVGGDRAGDGERGRGARTAPARQRWRRQAVDHEEQALVAARGSIATSPAWPAGGSNVTAALASPSSTERYPRCWGSWRRDHRDGLVGLLSGFSSCGGPTFTATFSIFPVNGNGT
jgi:hypothetical protein